MFIMISLFQTKILIVHLFIMERINDMVHGTLARDPFYLIAAMINNALKKWSSQREQNKIQIPVDEIPLGNINRFKNQSKFYRNK